MVAATFSRTTAGLLYRADGTKSGWYGADEWTSAADPRFVCHPTGRAVLGPGRANLDGAREPQEYREDGIRWGVADGGDGAAGWRQSLFRSADRGGTWEYRGPFGPQLAKKTGGLWAALAWGWVEKRGGTYYAHRVTSGTTFDSPNVGLTNSPFFWDCWTATSLDGPWTAAPNVPGDNYALGGSFTSEFLPGCVVKSGSDYIAFCQGGAGADYKLGICPAAASPDGPFSGATATVTATNATTGFGGRNPENPKGFHSATLARWVMLTNLIAVAGTHTDANGVGYSTSLTDWSGAVWHRTQRLCPLDGGTRAVGIACHVTGPDGLLTEGPGGEVPILFDGAPKRYTPGWHLGRECVGAVLEPAVRSLRIAQAANTTQWRISRDLSLADFVAEFSIEYTAGHASGGSVRFGYRLNSAGTSGYRVRQHADGLSLEKVTAGTPADVGTPTRTIVGQETFFAHRIRVVVSGNRHRLYLDGELQIDHTDSSSPIANGTHIEVIGQGISGDVRNLVVYSSDTLTVTGLVPGASVEVRAYGDLPLASAPAGADGVATVTLPHWPHYSLETGGSDPDADAQPLWGGDVIAVSYPDGRPTLSASVPVRARR